MLAVRSELLSVIKFPDHWENRGNLGRARMTGPAEINGFAREFPKGKTGNFLSQTGKLYSETKLDGSPCALQH